MIYYLSIDQIKKYCNQQIKYSECNKGESTIINENSLEYLVEIVKDDHYYPTIYHKASLYAEKIINNHIFIDGNKRTGIHCMLNFLALNKIKLTPSDKEIITLGEGIAEKNISYQEIMDWIKKIKDHPQ